MPINRQKSALVFPIKAARRRFPDSAGDDVSFMSQGPKISEGILKEAGCIKGGAPGELRAPAVERPAYRDSV
jgi:hypothetical protein